MGWCNFPPPHCKHFFRIPWSGHSSAEPAKRRQCTSGQAGQFKWAQLGSDGGMLCMQGITKKTLSLEAQARDVKAQYSFDFETSKTNLNIIFFNKGMNL